MTLVRPAPAADGGARRPARTASGSVAAPTARARVARASRIYVEGRHDAELVERIWGDDLRDVGVVVEYLGGIDDLPAIVAEFSPSPARRLGVLVDHLVTGSKETRIAESVASPHVLITGHPFIDVWAAVKPAVVGIPAWPGVPRGQDWKNGCAGRAGLAPGHRRRLEAHPVPGPHLRRPGPRLPRPGRGAHRLRHRTRRQLTRPLRPGAAYIRVSC